MKPDGYEKIAGSANIAQIIHGTKAEGPGIRTAIWFQGCSILCKNCCNPSFLPFKDNKWMTHVEIMDSIVEYNKNNPEEKVEGVTFIGGEPFDQPISLSILSFYAKSLGLTVMIFTGNTIEDLKSKNNTFINTILNNTDILVDGKYDDTKRTNDIRWVGSTNQRMHFLTNAYNESDPQFKEPNTVEYRLVKGELIMNGWPINSNKSPLIPVEELKRK